MSLILTITIAVGLGLGVILLLRWLLGRFFPADVVVDTKVVSLLIGTVGSFYGLLTGFILSGVWGNVDSARNAALAEVSALADLKRVAISLPGPTGAALSTSVDAYLQSVVNDEMTAMREGGISRETTIALDRLWSMVADSRSEAMPAEDVGRVLDKVDAVGEQRRIRILVNSGSIPGILWVILLLGGAIILYGSTVVVLRHGRPTWEVLAGVSVMLSLVLAAIYVMEQPYRRGLSPGTDRYLRLWEEFQVIPGHPATGSTARVPGSTHP